MDRTRSLTAVVFALHESPTKMPDLFRRVGLDPATVPCREIPWRHIRRSDAETELVFGPAGLKQVRATRLLGRLTDAGFRYGDSALVVKRAVYTKADERRSRDDDRTVLVREGKPKWDDHGKPAYKMYLESTFERESGRGLPPPAVMLEAFLVHTVWKRGRVLVGTREDGSRAALVELVRPKRGASRSVTELGFHPTRGFTSHVIDLP